MSHPLNTNKRIPVNVIEGIALASLLVLFVFLTRTDIITPVAKQWLTDGAWTVFSFIAAMACYKVSKYRTGRLKTAWLYFFYAHIAWFIGIIIWSYLELVAQQATPFPALSDLGFMLYAPLFLVGLYHFRQEERYYRNTILQLTKLGLIICCLLILHIYLLEAPLNQSKEDWFYKISALAYPVLYMSVLMYGLLSLLNLHERVSLPLYGLILLNLFIHGLTDTLYAYSLLGKSYQVGNYLDVFWLLAFGIMYLAASQARRRVVEVAGRQQFIYAGYVNALIVPALLLVVSVVIISNAKVWQQDNPSIYLYSIFALIIFVMIYLVIIARIEKALMTNLSASEYLLKKSNNELMHLATTSGEKLQDEIKKHKLTGEKLEQHHVLLNTIKKVQDEFIEGMDRVEFFEYLLSSILEVTSSEYGFIGEVLHDDKAPYLKTFALTNIAWNEETRQFYDKYAPEGMEFRNLDSLFGHVLRNHDVVISNDPVHDIRKGGLPEGHPALNAFLGIPLMVKNEMIGMVGVANRKDGYSEELLDYWGPFIKTCSNLVLANKLENQRKQAEHDLLIAKNEAEKANLAKSEFMSRMSHELRTPLNAVIGFAQLIELDKALSQENKESVNEIYQAGMHLLGLINDLLDISRIETDQLQYNFRKYPVRRIIDEAIQFSAGLANDKQVTVTLHPGQDCNVNADEMRLRQVFTNLLTNAIKYNRAGGKVDISIEPASEDYCKIVFSDNGIGIAEDKMSRLFSPFDRLDVEKYSTDGVGIGLHITRKIVETHQGEILVESQENKGSVFIVKIPLHK